MLLPNRVTLIVTRTFSFLCRRLFTIDVRNEFGSNIFVERLQFKVIGVRFDCLYHVPIFAVEGNSIVVIDIVRVVVFIL